MTVDPTCPSRATRQGPRPAAGAVEAPARARRRGRREPHSTPVQQVGRVAVDAPSAAAEDASLAHRDGAGPGIVEGGPSWGASAVVAVVVADRVIDVQRARIQAEIKTDDIVQQFPVEQQIGLLDRHFVVDDAAIGVAVEGKTGITITAVIQ